jgi:surface carbohydrate biosynthesis protein (TIGR04326 family)
LSGIDFSAYFKDDWDSSFIGAPALMNIVYFFLFEKLMHVSSIESAIVFLQENQPWERSLVYWSENQGFSNTVGVAHSSVRFWDLRYYHSSKDLCGTEIESQVPMPSITAVNGPLAKQQFLQSGFPSQKLREVEALRYEYLNYNDLHEFTNIKSDKALVGDELTLVILGDYNETDTSVLLAVVDQAMGCLSTRMRVRFKGHPLTKISLKQFPNLKGCAFNGSLDAALDEASIVITGCLTTGAVDAASRGLPVVSVLDDSALNLSPLLGCSGVSFVANADELVRALNDPRQLVGHDQSNFFFFSDNYSGWKNLFNVLESRRDQSNL